MRKPTLFFLLSRSGNEWLVGKEFYYKPVLMASVGDDPTIPPTTDWNFRNLDTRSYEEDQYLNCNISSASSFCSITMSLKGLAKEIQGEWEGEYKDTGLRSMGRKVHIQLFNIILCSL